MPSTHDQQPVQALAPGTGDPAFAPSDANASIDWSMVGGLAGVASAVLAVVGIVASPAIAC